MKKKLKTVLFIIASVIILMGCANKYEIFKNKQVDNNLEQMISCIQNQDVEAAYALLYPNATSEADFKAGFSELVNTYKGEEYTYQLSGINTKFNKNNSNDSTKTVQCQYKIDTEQDSYVAEIVYLEDDGGTGIYTFYMQTYAEYIDYITPAGKLPYFADFNAVQWILLAVSLVSIAFTIVTLINCMKSKIKVKPLWIILILILYLWFYFTVDIDGSIQMGFQVSLILYSRLLLYPSGAVQFYMGLPLGSILYWILKKVLIKKTKNNSDMSTLDGNGVIEGESIDSDLKSQVMP